MVELLVVSDNIHVASLLRVIVIHQTRVYRSSLLHGLLTLTKAKLPGMCRRSKTRHAEIVGILTEINRANVGRFHTVSVDQEVLEGDSVPHFDSRAFL